MVDIMGALATASQALKLVQDLRGIDKTLNAADYKLKIADLTDVLSNIKLALTDAKEDLASKDAEIDKLKKQLQRLTEMVEYRGFKYNRGKDGKLEVSHIAPFANRKAACCFTSTALKATTFVPTARQTSARLTCSTTRINESQSMNFLGLDEEFPTKFAQRQRNCPIDTRHAECSDLDACQRSNTMDWGKIALLLFCPLFVLGFVADKFNIQIAPARYIELTMFGLLAGGTLCVIKSWRSSQPQDPQARFLATLFFVVFDLWLLWLLWLAWRYGASLT